MPRLIIIRVLTRIKYNSRNIWHNKWEYEWSIAWRCLSMNLYAQSKTVTIFLYLFSNYCFENRICKNILGTLLSCWTV